MAGATPLGVGETPLGERRDGDRRLARRPAVLLPGVLDGAQLVQGGAGRQHQSEAVLHPDARPLQRRHRDRRPGCCRSARRSSNSFWVVVVSTVVVLVLAIPAAYALAIRPVPKWRDVLFFFISTKFLPVVAVHPAAVDPRQGLRPAEHPARPDDPLHRDEPPARRVDAALVLPGDPAELIEAAEIDGAGLKGQLTSVILPIAVPGIAATALLCVIFAWNEYFYAVQLNPADASTIPIWVTTNISTAGTSSPSFRPPRCSPACRSSSPGGWRRSA